MGFLSFLTNDKENIKSFLEKGAIIVDVRSREEFASGAAKGSINIPLGSLNGQLNKIKKQNKPVITCCRSGMRSGQAKSILESHGIEVMNGGPWHNVAKELG